MKIQDPKSNGKTSYVLVTAIKCTQQGCDLRGSWVPDKMHISEHSFGHSHFPQLHK